MARAPLSFPQDPRSLGRFSGVSLALHACLHCPLCLFSPSLYFYSFLLDAVFRNCSLNTDLTVFCYVYLVTKKTEVSFLT